MRENCYNLISLKKAIFKRKINLVGMTTAICVYIINKACLIPYTQGQLNYFCRCYLNDLVCPLFFLGYCQILLIWIDHEIKSWWKCMLLIMVAGYIWEYGAPFINAKAVSDAWDLVCYFLGGTVYCLLMKCEQNKQNKTF